MTVIEFFDAIAIHNALSALLLAPDRLVLFGTEGEKMHRAAKRLAKLFRERKLKTEVEVLHIPDKSYETILKGLESLLLRYRDSVFDLVGGETEMFVAMGALSQKYGTPMHTVDHKNGTLSAFVKKEAYPPILPVSLSIQEIITLYGGKVTESISPAIGDAAYWQDILAVWSVCRENCSDWNTAISTLHSFCTPEVPYPHLSMQKISQSLSPQKAEKLLAVLHRLDGAGCLLEYKETETTLSFRYKSRAVQSALSKEGSVLELYTYYAAYVLPRQKKAPFFDAKIGVVIEWESPEKGQDDVKNEMDVMLMDGLSPIFISCKNGFVDTHELYKLSVVAARFGGPYAKKAIVLSREKADISFHGRARELGISVIQDVQNISPSGFSKLLERTLKK